MPPVLDQIFIIDVLKQNGKQTHHIVFTYPNRCLNHAIIITCLGFSYKINIWLFFSTFLSITVVVSYFLINLCNWTNSFAPGFADMVLFFSCMPSSESYYPNNCRTSKGSCLLVSLMGQLCSDQIFFCPLSLSKNSLTLHEWYSHQCLKLFMLGRSMIIWIECLHTIFLKKAMYIYNIIWKQPHRPMWIPKAPEMMSLHCSAKFWYIFRSWFLVDLELHLSETGA